MTDYNLHKACNHLQRARQRLPFSRRRVEEAERGEFGPVAALVARAILTDDPMAVIRLREADDAARLFLDRLQAEHRPPQSLIDRTRARLATTQEERQEAIKEALSVDDGAALVGDLFRQAGDAVTLGTGRFPQYVPHTCGGGYVLTIEKREDGANPARIAPAAGKGWRWGEDGAPVCKACYDARVRRESLKALSETVTRPAYVGPPDAIYMSDPLPAPAARRQLAAWRKRKQRDDRPVRYATYPQWGGPVVIVHTDEGRGDSPLPVDRGQLFNALYPHLNTPEGRRIGGTPDWGYEFQGTRGDGRRKMAARDDEDPQAEAEERAAVVDRLQIWARKGSIVAAAEALGIELNKRKRGKAADVDPIEAYQRLIDLRHDVHVIGGNTRLAGFVGADVTLNAYVGDQIKTVCVKCDSDPPDDDPPAAIHLPGIGEIR